MHFVFYTNSVCKVVFIVLLSIIFSSCKTSRGVSEEEKFELEQLVSDRNFKVDLIWARPQATNSLNQIANAGLLQLGNTANQINLQSFNAIFKIKADTVIADLPYFGERQMGGGYNTNEGIKFEGLPENYEIKNDSKNNCYHINFNIREGTETFQVHLKVFSNKNTVINIASSQRLRIRYDGRIKALKSKVEGG